jgi:DNA-directed RNA polymerase II subunit RPB2
MNNKDKIILSNITQDKFNDWLIINEFFNKSPNYFTISQIDSYNDFVMNKIPYTIRTLNQSGAFTMLKYYPAPNQNILKYQVNVFIGGRDGDKIFLGKPIIHQNGKNRPLYPNEARLKDWNYISELHTDILIEYLHFTDHTDNTKVAKTEKTFYKVHIADIPIMVKSKLCILDEQPKEIAREMGECVFDQGGYFIIDGKEKVILSQERIATNQLFVEKSKDADMKYQYNAYVRCTSQTNFLFPKTNRFYIYRDNKDMEHKKKLFKENNPDEDIPQMDSNSPNAIGFNCPNLTSVLPLFIIFRALGIESDKEIIQYIVNDIDDPSNKPIIDFLRYSIIHANFIYNQIDAQKYLTNFIEYRNNAEMAVKLKFVNWVLQEELFPNVGTNFYNKAYYLGFMTNKFLKVYLGLDKPIDKDNYLYKRIDLSGYLLAGLFRDFYNQFRRNVRDIMDKEYNNGGWSKVENPNIADLIHMKNLQYIFPASIISEAMKKSLKGNWALYQNQKEVDSTKAGIAQDLPRLSYPNYISYVRKINTPLDRSIKLTEPHKLYGTHFGSICPTQTPEGGSIGLIKHFSVLTLVSFDIDATPIFEACRDFGVILNSEISITKIGKLVKIFLNNNWIGIHHEPIYFFQIMKLLKRNSIINPYISVSWDIIKGEIHLRTDSGRSIRPVYIIDRDPKTNKSELRINKIFNTNKFTTTQKDKYHLINYTWDDLIKGQTIDILDLDYTSSEYKIKFLEKEGLAVKVSNSSDEYKKGYKYKLEIDILRENSSYIEYIDIDEMNTSLIAMTRTYINNKKTHHLYDYCEIDPSLMLSANTNVVPFYNHNPATRVSFATKHIDQAIGVYATNFNNRIDVASYILHYPQRSMVHTKYSKYMHSMELPNGENIMVAIMTYTGYNQEDSIMINKSSIERGMFNITKFKAVVDEEDISDDGKNNIKFGNPLELQKNGEDINIPSKDWTHIDQNGLPKENHFIDTDKVFLGKIQSNIINKIDTDKPDNIDTKSAFDILISGNIKKTKYIDKSKAGNKSIKGFVDKVFVYEKDNEKNIKKVKIRFRKFMIPELGDKLCSSYGQKGVCGMIYEQKDMPFNKDGISPDIIINPHAIPTRMTLGQFIECALTKLCCKKGVMLDATAWGNQSLKDMYNLSSIEDLNRYGDEILYNGITGEQITTKIFFGPTYYYRLKHIVSDKINHRTTGPKTGLTRQPAKGRANDGGLRIGEMETGSLIAHGISSFYKEKMLDASDKFRYFIENNHGSIAIGKNINDLRSIYNKPANSFSTIQAPYSFKLLTQELEAMSIKTTLITDKALKENASNIEKERIEIQERENIVIDYNGISKKELEYDEDSILF